MSNVYRSLPPLSTLIGFEAAARLGSFSLAAAELNITQSAISHQIRTLEDHLGTPLFRRIGRGIELTDAGRDLQATAQSALEGVRHGVRRLNAYTKPGSVIIALPPGLADCWLVPRLAQFRADLPDVDPWLHVTGETTFPEESEIDVVLSDRPWTEEGAECRPLPVDRVCPMASPALADSLGRLPEPERLDKADLLHDETPNDWLKWFALAGSARRDLSRGMNFSDHGLMLRAAAAGLGVCLGSERWAADLLASGALVRVAGTAMAATDRLYLCAWRRNFVRPAVGQVWDWFAQETGAA